MQTIVENIEKTKNEIVKIKSIAYVTYDTLKIVTSKPKYFSFIPGQATLVSLNVDNWRDKMHPFTLTSIPENDYLEFIIKIYKNHEGITTKLSTLKFGNELILHEVFGAIHYKDEGLFIAGGAGITAFISIFRELKIKNKIGTNRLIFANKTKADIIMETELLNWLGENLINILSEEKANGCEYGLITEQLLRNNIKNKDQYFYVCGPPPMVKSVISQLQNIGINDKYIVREKW
jgi:ferredoxin-NADP reductase